MLTELPDNFFTACNDVEAQEVFRHNQNRSANSVMRFHLCVSTEITIDVQAGVTPQHVAGQRRVLPFLGLVHMLMTVSDLVFLRMLRPLVDFYRS